MGKLRILTPAILVLTLLLVLAPPALGQRAGQLANCKDFAYSTEEDFITQGPVPADGDPIISDGDLLGRFGAVCMRNAELVQVFDVTDDMGLDAVDVLDVDQELVAFSTELNSPFGNFKHGDLLTTWGAAIPNEALLVLFQVTGDRGLDAIHFIGQPEDILRFNQLARSIARDEWLRDRNRLVTELQRYKVDIWFSIEGTELSASTVPILDGHVLSAAAGIIVVGINILLPAGVPAGIPQRGVDFGLDAVTAQRSGPRDEMRYSTEILYRGEMAFSDGDILKIGNGVDIADHDLYNPFEPRADFLGTDALYMRFEEQLRWKDYLPLILRRLREMLP